MLRYRTVLAFVAWTLLIWPTRIANIWRDEDLDMADRVAATGLALSFTLLALAVVVAGGRGAPGAFRRAVTSLAGWTAVVWAVRSVDILTDDWSVGFKLVHSGLALVSVVLAALGYREVRVRAAGQSGRGGASGAAGVSWTSRARVRQRQPPPAFRNSSTGDSTTVNPHASS